MNYKNKEDLDPLRDARMLKNTRILKKLGLSAGHSFSWVVCLAGLIAFEISWSHHAQAACGGTTLNWLGTSNTNWSQTNNWTAGNVPSIPGEDAIVTSKKSQPALNTNANIGCLEIQSGTMTIAGNTLTINGDYFRNLTAGSLSMSGGTIVLAGGGDQTFENYDGIETLTISNDSTVTFTHPFEIRTGLNLSGTTTLLKVAANLTLTLGSTLTIPAGVTVEVQSGAILDIDDNVTVNGTLKIKGGGKVVIADGKTITVNSGGTLYLNGSSGNIATLESKGVGKVFHTTVNSGGIFKAEYFRINRQGPAGIQVSGTIAFLNYGEFHYIKEDAIRLESGATIPSTMNSIGFYDEEGNGATNIDASSYAGSDTQLDNYSGDRGGEAYDNESGTRIDWGSPAGTVLTLSDNTPAGSPPSTIGQSAGPTYFGTFAFALSATDTATTITEVIITLNGTVTSSDVSYIQVYKDAGGGASCVYDAGTDTQIGSDINISGSPPQATVDLTGQGITTSSTTPVCLHVLLRTTATAVDDHTVAFKIASTSDVSNSAGYSFSSSSGPPVTLPSSLIVGSNKSTWDGHPNTTWTNGGNWVEGAAPSATRDCVVGAGSNNATLGGNRACQNATLPSGGTLVFGGGTAYTLSVSGSLDVASGYNFTNATNGTLSMAGSGNQSLQLATLFPGHLSIDNTGTSPNDVVSVEADSSISGNLTVNNGTLRISSGYTLTVGGSVTVASGATLDIEPGASLIFSTDESVLTVSSGGTLELVGTSGNEAGITSSSTSIDYWINVQGTIKARYYQISRLGVVGGSNTGLTIGTGATLDSTNHLQDGAFSYPVDNNTKFLVLGKMIPPADGTETLANMSFNLSGSSATGVINISTDASLSGDVELTDWSGDRGGATYEEENGSYDVQWATESNTIEITANATASASGDAGSSVTMGRFGFNQAAAGSYSDADITTLRIELTGTGSASDVEEVRAYYDSNCDGAGGTLIGTQTFSGVPAKATFSFSAGAATIPADASSPPTRCIYLQYDVATATVDGTTLGAQLGVGSDFVTDQGYALDSSTPAPISLGTTTVAGATVTSWTGGTSTDWFTASNWSAGLPDATKHCEINVAPNNPNINGASGTAICKNLTIGTGTLTLQNGTSAVLAIYGSFENTGTLTQNDGTLRMSDDGATPTNQTINSTSTISGLTFDKIAGGEVSVIGSSQTIGTLTIPSGSEFTFRVPNGKILQLDNSITNSDITFQIEAGGTLKMANGTTFTVNSGGILKMLGTSSSVHAKMTSTGSTAAYNVVINTGEIQAQYYTFEYLGTNGVSIESGATINTTYHLQDGKFTYPVNSSSTLLKLKRQVPTHTMNNMVFELNGSSATGTVNIDTTGASAGTLTVNSYSGDVSGPSYDTDPSYLVSWAGAQNSIEITQEATGPASVDAGSTYTMGRFGFQQAQAGASYSDADITSLKLTLKGTATASDIQEVKIYYDSDCDSSSGTLIGTGTMSGSPATVTFSLSAGQATIQADASSPPLRCIYVTYAIANGAVNGRTAGVELATNAHFANDVGYTVATATPLPVNLGSYATIVGATTTTWTGTTSTDWFTAGNWDSGLPDATKSCTIPNVTNDPVINGASGTAICKTLNITNGILTMTNGTGAVLEVYGNYQNTGILNQNDGSLKIRDNGSVATDQTITSSSTISALTFDKTAGGTASIASSALTINTLTFPAGSNFEFKVPASKTLTLSNSLTNAEVTFTIEAGGVLKMANGTTFTVNSGGVLKMVGASSSSRSKMTSTGSSASYNVVVNTGEIQARYYEFEYLGTNGVSIESGATVDASNYLQDGKFTYPVNSSSTFLKLKRQIPGDTLTDMEFSSGGSAASSITNVDTTGASAGTLTINTFVGDLSGASYDVDPSYLVSWTGALNTILVTQEAAGPSSVNAGSTYNMGRFGFQQAQAGASYSNTDITTLRLTLKGTATSSDISAVRIYYDSDCDSSGGTQIGSGTFAGTPATVLFSPTAGQATVQADVSAPPLRCIYVEYDISNGAVNGNTAGVELAQNAHFANSQGYSVDGTTPLPVNLGSNATIAGSSSTTWAGTTSTNWFTPSNWSAGLPDSTKNCIIPNVANDPVINGASGTAVCKLFQITDGVVTMTNGTSAVIEVYGNYENTGTLTQNDGVLRIRDDGSTVTTQTVVSNNAISSLTFNKTAGGASAVALAGNVTIDSFTMPSGSNFEFRIPDTYTLTLTAGATITAGTFNVQGGGTVKVADAQTITVNGGTFKVSGTHDALTQVTTNKGKITNNGSGRWGFNATSGTVDLTGFLLDYLDVNGLRIEGSTNLSNLKGGQLSYLSTDFATPMKAIQINTSGSVPASASDVGWNWDGPNTDYASSVNKPGVSDSYYLVYAPACGSSTITFDEWFGDFTDGADGVVTENKIYDTDDGGPTCQISIAASASPVTLASFTAAPYDGAVVLDWETTSELDHRGFNVYRSQSPNVGFVQVNNGLILNFFTSTSYHGVYRYKDTEVQNGLTYYYKIEDVAVNGAKEMHGPVSARPSAEYGPPPATDPGTNLGDSGSGSGAGNGMTGGSITNPSWVDLGNGVHLLAQTENFLRIEIVPPSESYAVSPLDAGFEDLSVPGYANLNEVGKPALPERVILIEVSSNRSSASVINEQITEAAPSTHRISPAPSWALDGSNVLQPTFALDSATYSLNSHWPSSFYQVASALRTIGGKKYLEVKATPFRYNPTGDDVRKISKIQLDIALDGIASWQPSPSNDSLSLAPALVEGALRIRYAQQGMYEIAYEDLVTAAAEGPFAGAALADFRLYYHGVEVPIEVSSADATFGPGDRIRFHAQHQASIEDDEDEVVLSRFAISTLASPPLRMQRIDANPLGYPASTVPGTTARAFAEVDSMPLFDSPTGDLVDRFYWTPIYGVAGYALPGPPETRLEFAIDLPHLMPASAEAVKVKVNAVGRYAYARNPIHHLGIFVNGSGTMAADRVWADQTPVSLEFEIPASSFVAGSNTLRLQVLADLVPAGDWDLVYINNVEVTYQAAKSANNGVASVSNPVPNQAITVAGFGSSGSISIYDVTTPGQCSALYGFDVASLDGGVTRQATYAARSAGDGELGHQFLAVADGSFLKPLKLVLGRGADVSLKSMDHAGTDLVVIGSRSLLYAVNDLIQQRRTDGLQVLAAPLDQIYAEFSHGRRSSQAIRDFLAHLRTQFSADPPRYLLLIGDATYDPKDRMLYGRDESVMPLPIEMGTYMDFGNDNWFVAGPDGQPTMAVGRIPTSDPVEASAFVDKILRYESGERAPSDNVAKSVAIISDTSNHNESFGRDADRLASTVSQANSDYLATRIDRSSLGSNAATKSAIVGAFEDAPLAITYLGHGAENAWASLSVFTDADANALEHDRLPMVVALNCLNSMFYDPDPAFASLGERIVLNSNGGAVAFFGSTAMTAPPVQIEMADAFIKELGNETRQGYREVRIGDLFLRAKASQGSRGGTRDVIRSFTLFGDPTMKLPAGAFSKAPQEPSSAAPTSGSESSEDDRSGGGFLGCGSLDVSGGGSGGSAGAMAEFGFMLLLMYFGRMLIGRRRALSQSPLNTPVPTAFFQSS